MSSRSKAGAGAIILLLATSCGGGGNGGSGGGGGGTVITPTPSPTTSPTSTPTSEPTPTPVANQCNFTTDRSFSLFGAEVVLTASQTPAGTVYSSITTRPVDANRQARLAYTLAGQTIGLSIDGAALLSFGPQQRTQQTPYILSHEDGARRLTVFCEEGLGTQYVALVNQQTGIGGTSAEQSYRLMFGGRDAQAGDRLVSRTYSVLNYQTRTRLNNASDVFVGPLSTLNGMDFVSDTGRVRGAFNLSTRFGEASLIRFETILAPGSSTFTGAVRETDADGNTVGTGTGTISGRFYGPGGEEVGYVVTFERGQERFVIVGIAKGS